MERFISKKRTAIDNKVWWCVFDMNKHQFSTYLCHGIYKTKKDCDNSINYWNKKDKEKRLFK